MKVLTIYLITNLTNGKRYVGQTRLPLERRWKQHLRDAANGSTTLIGRAVRKYGADSFSVVSLCTCSSQEELDTREREFIRSLGTHSSTGNGYNLTDGGFGGQYGTVGPMTGKHHSVETRARMRRAHEGKPHPQKFRDQRGSKNAMWGNHAPRKPCSASRKKKIGDANRGRIRSAVTRQALEEGLSYTGIYMRQWRKRRHENMRYYGA
jgi:group I intron endonuclease